MAFQKRSSLLCFNFIPEGEGSLIVKSVACLEYGQVSERKSRVLLTGMRRHLCKAVIPVNTI